MAREDYLGTYYAHIYQSGEYEGGEYDPGSGGTTPITETLTGNSYELMYDSGYGGYIIDTSKISSFDEATELPTIIFNNIPGEQTELERRIDLFPDTYYSRVYVYPDEIGAGEYDPVTGVKEIETVTGENYEVMEDADGNYIIRKSSVTGLDEGAQLPEPLFETYGGGFVPGGVPEFARAYYMTVEEVETLSQVQVPDGESGFYYASQYLINILQIPFTIPAAFISESKEGVYFGGGLAGGTAYKLLGESVYVDYAEIQVDGIYGNSRDYDEAEYVLKLPYISSDIELNPYDVVGKTVFVEFAFDIYTGDATATIYTDDKEKPIGVVTGSVGRTVPFSSVQQDRPVSSSAGFNNAFSLFTTPFIKVEIPEISGGDKSNFISVEGTLQNVGGFVSVDEIELNVNGASLAELNEIRAMLSDGVIIK